jgi:long-chain fatty acid transport protein
MPKTPMAAALALALVQCLQPLAACAANGLNMIGFGTESIGMGGADVAVARDTTALNTNPAGLMQLRGTAFDQYMATAYALDVSHADRLGNDAKVDNETINIGGFGFSTRLAGLPVTIGIGAFAQGGAGNVYRDLATPFGSRDELAGLFAIARLSPGFAWRVSEELSVGAAVPITHARFKQRTFAGVSVFNPADPSQSFFGSIVKDLRATRVGARVGVRYEVSPVLALAAVYQPKTQLPLKKGYADVNFTALGLGVVRYREVHIDGLALPQEAGVGAAWHATARTLLSFEVTWLDWSKALRSQTLTATNPVNGAAPGVLQQTLRIDWRDQYVFALGAAHDVDDRLTLYAGANYGRNPVPAQTTSPVLAATGDTHVTTGARFRLGGEWLLSGSLEYLFRKTVTYNNPALPFGPGAQERNEYVAVHLMLGRRW